MHLNEKQIAKTDSLLKEQLEQAAPDSEIIAILLLDLKKPLDKEPFHPKSFPTYENYRQALIAYRLKEFASGLGDTLQELRNLSLKILTGGSLMRYVAVEGTASQIVQALDNPCVLDAMGDRSLRLPEHIRGIQPLQQTSTHNPLLDIPSSLLNNPLLDEVTENIAAYRQELDRDLEKDSQF